MIEYDAQSPLATDNEDLANIPGMASVQEVIVEDDGDGVDSDPDGMLVNSTVDLAPSMPMVNDKTLVVPGRGTWTEDGMGNVTFTQRLVAMIILRRSPIRSRITMVMRRMRR